MYQLCTNCVWTTQMFTFKYFCKCWSFIWGIFFRVSIIKQSTEPRRLYYPSYRLSIGGVRKNAPGEKAPRKNVPKKIALRKNAPRKNVPQENCPPENYPPGKLFHQIFVAFNIILQFLIFKLFIVASFRGVSRTPVVSIMDLLVTVVNGSN